LKIENEYDFQDKILHIRGGGKQSCKIMNENDRKRILTKERRGFVQK